MLKKSPGHKLGSQLSQTLFHELIATLYCNNLLLVIYTSTRCTVAMHTHTPVPCVFALTIVQPLIIQDDLPPTLCDNRAQTLLLTVMGRGVLVLNLSGRSYLVGRIHLRMGANAQIGEN